MGKKLEDETVGARETELGKRVIATSKTRGFVVIAYRDAGGDAQVVVRRCKKVTGGWAVEAYEPHPAKVWCDVARAIQSLTKT